MARRNPTDANVRVGNYRADVDTAGLGSEFNSLFGTPYSKEEKAYVEGKGGSASSKEAVRRARRANRQSPPSE